MASDTSNYSMPYNDRDSSPDYDSQSEDLPQEKQRVRGGTRKVVGDAETKAPIEDYMTVDFGRTLRLTPENSRPNTAAGNRSLQGLSQNGSSGRRSPFDSLGHPSPSAFTSRPVALASPARTPEKQSPTNRPSLSRLQSYAWRPRNGGGSTSPDGLSPEDFVRQRAALAMQPQGFVTQRSFSSGRVEQLRSDQADRPSTPPSPSPRRLQRRPTSRQSSSPSIDYSAHLSAREQEVVARMTGGPLLSNVNQKNRTPDPNVGLIGAIEARDQEKENIKRGLQGKMLQAALDQRYRETRTAQIHKAAQHRRTQSQYMAQQQQYQQQHQASGQYQYSQQPQANTFGYWRATVPQHQDARVYQHSMYEMPRQSAVQMTAVPDTPDIRMQAGSLSRSYHHRPQSSYSQYGGLYGPQR